VTLAVGARTSIQGTPWTLVFDSVVSDSRCPERVVCIQAGEALLALELASPMADPVPPDNPHFTLGATPVVIEGLRFTTVTVTPVSQVGEAIDPRSYRVTLRVEAVSGS
jgi:hypothetical protein